MVGKGDALLDDIEWRIRHFGTDWKTAPASEAYDAWSLSRREQLKTLREIPTTTLQNEILTRYKGRYEGERIFVIGNGPSLNETDLSQLSHEFTFAVNKFYLMYDRLDWRPTFWICNDWEVTGDNLHDFFDLGDSTVFWPTRFNGALDPYLDVVPVNTRLPREPGDDFSYDAVDGVVMGDTVLNVVIQLCAYMGFSEIYLIGVDVSYVVEDTVKQHGALFENGVRQFLESTTADVNHFDPNYFGAGKKWHNPNPNRMIDAFARCEQRLHQTNTRMYNATVGGALDQVPRVAFDSLFVNGTDTPLVSVVVPAFNAEDTLGRLADSVFRQSYRNWELIIVDDGSTDATEIRAKELADRDERIRVVSQENSGRSVARNRGLAEARGKYVVFLDADDTLLGGKLATQVAFLEEHPDASGVVGGYVRVNDDGRVLRRKTYNERPFVRSDFWSGAPFQLGAAMFRASALPGGLFDTSMRHAEDWEMMMRLATTDGVQLYAQGGLVSRYTLSEGAKSKGNLDFGLGHIDVVETYMQRYATMEEWVDDYPNSRKAVGCRVAARAALAGQIDDAAELMKLTMAAVPLGTEEYQRLLGSEIEFWRTQLASTAGLSSERLTEEVLGAVERVGRS